MGVITASTLAGPDLSPASRRWLSCCLWGWDGSRSVSAGIGKGGWGKDGSAGWLARCFCSDFLGMIRLTPYPMHACTEHKRKRKRKGHSGFGDACRRCRGNNLFSLIG